MSLINITVDIDAPRAALRELRDKQLPFTIAKALTYTAQDGQAESRRVEGQVFKLRNDWLTYNTKIKAATKDNLVAVVYEDSRNRKGDAPDYLGDQEDGGIRGGYLKIAGAEYRAIPTKYLNPFGTVIPRELMPQNLLQAADGKYTVTVTRRIGDFKYQRNAIRRQQLVRGMSFFVVQLTNGTLAICTRIPPSQEAIPFYILTPSARVGGIFPMQETVERVVDAKFEENFHKAGLETIASDLLRGSGIEVRL